MAENHPQGQPRDEAANLPAVPDEGAIEPVLEGEVVAAPPRPHVYVLRVLRVVQAPPARSAGRHAAYVAAGAVVAWRRHRAARALSAQMGQQARAAGDHASALLWAKQAEEERQARHDRRVETAKTVVLVAKFLPFAAGGLAALAFFFGCLLSARWGLRGFEWPWRLLVSLAVAVADVVSFAWLAVIAAAAAALAFLHETGRRGGSLAPGWSLAARPGEEDRGLVVTADGIVVALRNLSVSKLDKAFKEGWQPSFRVTPVRDGDGYSAVFSLPMGVTAGMIADRNDVFARNLHRAKTEVWPTDAERDGAAPAGYVSLWVASPGVLDKPAPDWPLLHEGTADVFRGVPAGVTARGNPVLVPVVGHNFSIGGLMGQGKSNACRVVMLGGALDPLAVLAVHVFAYNGDFDAFAPRLAVYVKGAEDDQVDAAMETLHRLYREVGEREQALADLGAKKVTRHLAERHPELRPQMTLFSECHELFGHRDYGEEATELGVRTIRRARKTAIWMGFDTQDSRKDAIPPKLLSLVSVRSCLPVTTWRANDGFLWDGAFQAGVRATELRPGRDTGRSITTGVSNEQFEILKWHYIFANDETGEDDAAPVIARAMANLAPGTAAGDGSRLPVIEARDLLADLAAVLAGHSGRVRVADLPAMLRRLAPSWGPYRDLNGVALRALLDDEGIRTTNTGNVRELDAGDLRRAVTAREIEE